jgi:hypothetical protein
MRCRVALFSLIPALATLCGCNGPSSADKGKQPTSGDVKAVPKAIAAQATQLRKEGDDDAAFKLKYKDAPIEVEGVVWAVELGEKSVVGDPDVPSKVSSIALAGREKVDNIFDTVECYLKEPDTFRKVGLGQRTKLRGKIANQAAKGRVVLLDCVFVSESPSELRAGSAEELAAEYEKDRAGFLDKYEGKAVLVKGAVERVAQHPPYDYPTAYMKGTKDVGVACNISILHRGIADRLKAGDTTEFLCRVQKNADPEKLTDKTLALSDCQPVPQK